MNRAALFLNGNPPDTEEIRRVTAERERGGYDTVFCTDGAYSYLSPIIFPDTVLGDFDSLDRAEVHASCEVLEYDSDKDLTDGLLAMQILAERGYTAVDIYGAYGGRPDMAESNYALLVYASAHEIEAKFCGGYETYLVRGKFTVKTVRGAIFSLVPFSDEVHILYTKGLKYALTDYIMGKFDASSSDCIMGVSNRAESEEVEIALSSGVATVFVQRVREV